jgi:hypothetical protein
MPNLPEDTARLAADRLLSVCRWRRSRQRQAEALRTRNREFQTLLVTAVRKLGGFVGDLGHVDGVRSPERASRASVMASRLSVFTRSPGRRGISEGAITKQGSPFRVR